MPKTKAVTKATYQNAVKECIRLVEAREKVKMKIAEIAYKTCDIVLGGHVTGEVFSLTQFAQDIGVNRKTLSDWVHNYEISVKLAEVSKDKKFLKDTPENQNQLNRVRKKLRSRPGGLKKNITTEAVVSAYEEVEVENEEDVLLKNLGRYIKTLDYQITCDQMKLEYVDQKELAKIHEFSKRISAKLDRYFAVYEKPEVNLRKLAPEGLKKASKTKARNLRVVN